MHKWQKFLLVVVLGLILVAPQGAAGLATSAELVVQPVAQLGCVAQGVSVSASGGWYLCVPVEPSTNVNWNS